MIIYMPQTLMLMQAADPDAFRNLMSQLQEVRKDELQYFKKID